MTSAPCHRRMFGPALQLVTREFGPTDFGLSFDPPTEPITTMRTPVEWMRHCELSGQEEKFVASKVCKLGLIGECTHCGEERIAAFTHTQGETL